MGRQRHFIRDALSPFFRYTGGMHRVLLSFQLYKTKWRVGFLEADCKTSLPLKLDYTDPAKIRTIFERTAASKLLEDEQVLADC